MDLNKELQNIATAVVKNSIPKDIFIIDLLRDTFFDKKALGKLYFEDKVNEFCQTLEDKIRLPDTNGIILKVHAQTAIFEGLFKVKRTFSPRFNKKLPLIYNMPDFTLLGFGIQFEGLRFHGGNDEDDSEGCPCVAKHRSEHNTIFNSMSNEVDAKIAELEKKYKQIYVNVKNLNNQNYKNYVKNYTA